MTNDIFYMCASVCERMHLVELFNSIKLMYEHASCVVFRIIKRMKNKTTEY